MEWLETIFLEVLLSSFTASILGIGILISKWLFKNKISPSSYYILWLLVFIKLIAGHLVPSSPVTAFNLVSYESHFIDKNSVRDGTKKLMDQFTNKGSTLKDHDIINPHFESSNKRYATEDRVKTLEKNTIDVEVINSHNKVKDNIMKIVSIVWISGVCIIAFILFLNGWLFSKKVKELDRLEDKRLLEIVKNCTESCNIKKDITVFVSPYIISPCIFGLFNSKIILPQNFNNMMQEDRITHIIMHELAHLKRRDNLTNLIMVIGQMLHWFNPIIWYIALHMKLDREIACDTYVLERLGEAEAVPYGMTLIKFIEVVGNKPQKIGLLNFTAAKRQIERRIWMIKKFKKNRYALSAAAIAIGVVIIFIALTNTAKPLEKVKASAASNQMSEKNDSDKEGKALKLNTTKVDKTVKFKIGRQSPKNFNSLQRARDFINFDFKVPDFVPSGYKFERILLFKPEVNKESEISIYFSRGSNSDGSYFCEIAKDNLLDEEVSWEYELCQRKPLTIGEKNGTLITRTPRGYKGEEKKTVNYTHKKFVWQEEGLWYRIKVYNMQQGEVTLNISNEDLTKIVQSMTKASDVKNVTYAVPDDEGLNIYDETDLEKAEKMLGFKTEFPLNLIGGYYLLDAYAVNHIKTENSVEIPKILSLNYLSERFKGKKVNAIVFGKNLITFKQTNDTLWYDSLIKQGYVVALSDFPEKQHKVMTKLLNSAGCDVYSFDGVDVCADMSMVYNKDRILYVWKKDDKCYMLLCYKSINNKQQILKQLILKEA